MSGKQQPHTRAMDEGARKWMLKTVRSNHWRVAHWIDLDDMIQDGHLQWQRVIDKYPDVHEPAHLMRLYQRTLTGYFHDLATKRTREHQMLIAYLVSDPNVQKRLAPSQRGDTADPRTIDTTFLARLAKAPPEIRTFIQRLADEKVWAELRRPFRKRGNHRETLNERLCRIAGIPPTVDFTHQLVSYFQQA